MAGPRYGTVDMDLARRFATTAPEDVGPIWMVMILRPTIDRLAESVAEG